MANCKTSESITCFCQGTKKRIALLLLLFLVFSAGGCKSSSANPEGEESLRNSQAYYDALASLEEGRPVLLFLMDGFGYSQYEAAKQQGKIDFLDTLGEAKKAEVYFPSISPVGLAAMVTGCGPEKNGITKRGDTQLMVADIFKKTVEMGKKPLHIEGDVKLINTSIEPLLNADLDGDGLTDEEVYRCAMEQVDKGYDLILIHFHGIDDVAHLYGPLSEEAMDRTELVVKYMEDICAGWQGNVIVTADHGQHETEDGGSHGTEDPRDMMVPYLIDEETNK